MTRCLPTVLILIFVGAGAATAQSWDAPSFFAPRPADDLGVYASTSGDIAGLAIWRDAALPVILRGGIGITEGTVRAFAGGQYHRAILPAVPFDVVLTAGAGVGMGDHLELWAPVGVSAGRAFVLTHALTVMPYVHPRVGPTTGTQNGRQGWIGVVDFGADLVTARHGTIRLGLSLGDETVFGVGLSLMPSPALPFL